MSEPQNKRIRAFTKSLSHAVFVDAFAQLDADDAEAVMRKLTKRHFGLAKMWLGLYPPYAKLIHHMFGCVTYAEWKRLKVRLGTLMPLWTHGWIHTAHYHNSQHCVHLFTGAIPPHGSAAKLDGRWSFTRMITGWTVDIIPEWSEDRYPTIVPYDEFILHVWDVPCIPYVDGVSLKDMLCAD